MNDHMTLSSKQQHNYFEAIFKVRNGGVYMSSRNRAVIPAAQEALDRFKFEVANEIGVPLKQGYNGDLTSKHNGSVGGYMVKKMIEDAENRMANK
jgi:hypothetical protein